MASEFDRWPIHRRDFLKLLGISGASLLLSNCRLSSPEVLPPTPTTEVLPSATAPDQPTQVVAETPLPTRTPDTRTPVSTAKAESYDIALLRAEMGRMMDDLGGLGQLVKPGARVGIKPNLTAGAWIDGVIPVPAVEMYTTHPSLVQVLAELLIDAGAGEIIIMEGMYDDVTYRKWGYDDAAAAVGAELIDLNSPAPYGGFANFPVGSDYDIYDSFVMNGLLNELDVFISVAKLKCHTSSGVTLALKNLFGLPPMQHYRVSESHNHRSEFHGDANYETRVPRVILDLNRARPIDLAVIDGIMTAEAAAGPWDDGAAQVKPGMLVAGFDPVAVDTVSTAVMGFDPNKEALSEPFTYCDNHLSLAAEAGLGINLLDEIGVKGKEIEDLRYPFRPAVRGNIDRSPFRRDA